MGTAALGTWVGRVILLLGLREHSIAGIGRGRVQLSIPGLS